MSNSRKQIKEAVLGAIGRFLSQEPDEAWIDCAFEELGIDSLSKIVLLCELEKEKLLEIDVEQFSAKIPKTVGALIAFIEASKADKAKN